MKLKRAEREEAEKVDDTEREKQRRMMGKEIAKTKEQLDQEQRKREAYLRKKEKDAFQKERLRLREELARDRAERAAHKGKLSSRLGVDGYKPDGIQYDVPVGAGDDGGADNWFMALHMAQVGGLPYRIFVSALGLLVTMLSVTGVVIWMKKRSARIAGRRRLVKADQRFPDLAVVAE